MEQYRLVVDNGIDMSGKRTEGTLLELVKSTGFCFYEVDDPERPFLVYRNVDELERDHDGSHAIGHLEPIQEME
jgi:sugar/nucleoside kinase (ribokinase family)